MRRVKTEIAAAAQNSNIAVRAHRELATCTIRDDASAAVGAAAVAVLATQRAFD